MIRSRLTIRREASGYATEVVEWREADAQRRRVTGRIDDPLPPLAGVAAPPLDVLANFLVDARCPARDAGAYLLSMLSRSGLQEWLEEVRKGNPGPRSILLDVADPDLRDLPWEMLYDPEKPWEPFLDSANTWARAAPPVPELPPLVPPVRLLFAAGRYDDVTLKADDELDGILRALCRHPAQFHVEYLVAPTREEFRRAYDEVRPDVLHVVAHGESSRGEPVLSLRDQQEDAWALTRSGVTTGMTRWPRLVVLNACRSGTGSEASQSSWRFTETFLDKGTGAVVAMQGDIPAFEGVRFTERFYAELAAGSAVDVAVRQARRAIHEENEAVDVWSIPTLTLGAPPDAILRTAALRQQPSRLQDVATKAVGWVDRAPERRRVWTTAAPEDSGRASRLIVVTGGLQTGKSAVVKAALPACHARGCDIAYVDFGPSSRLGWFAAVRRVHDDLLDWLPEHAGALRRFEHTAESLRTGTVVAEDLEEPCRFGGNDRFENEADTAQHRKERIFRELRTLITGCAAQNRLLLVLDHLATGLTDEARDDYIVPRLIQPLVEDASPPVVVVAVLSDSYSLPPDLGTATAEAVGMPEFEKRLFEALLREYISRQSPDQSALLDQRVKDNVRFLAAGKDSWKLQDLQVLGAAAVTLR